LKDTPSTLTTAATPAFAFAYNEKLTLALLIGATAIGPLALNIFIPSMPGLLAALATDYGSVQLALTLYLLGTAVAQLFLGSWSDRFGRRPVLLLGLVLFLIGSIASAMATSIELLIAARIVQAVGGCAGMVLGRAIVRDMYPPEIAASKIAYVTMAMVVAPMLAPTLGGFLDVWFSWRASFIAVALFGAGVLLFSVRLLPETLREPQPLQSIGRMFLGFFTLLRSPLFCGYALNMAFTAAIFFSFLAGAPYVMVELLERTPAEYGLYFILVSFCYMGGNFIAGRLSRRLGIDRMLLISAVLAVLATGTLLLLALAGILTPMAIFGPMMLVAVANGINLPNSTTGAISVNSRMTGAASGLSGFLQISTGALATYIVGQLQNDNQWPMVLSMFCSALLALAAYLLVFFSARR
jgi:DHA1 family bicyclomycin/chloramphenicol resistance-like MFS transporter